MLHRSGSLFLVHGDASPPGVAAGDQVVALTPSAFAACAAGGLEATVVDDHIGRELLLAAEVDHLRWELGWLDRLDAAAGGGGGARAAAAYLVQPLDSVVLAAWVLRALIEATPPTRLVYVGPTLGDGPDPVPFHASHLQFSARLGDAPLASRLLPLLARQLDLPYEEVATEWPTWPESARVRPGRQRVISRLAAMRNTLPLVSTSLKRAGRATTGTTLACWSSGYGAKVFIDHERRDGRRVLFLARGTPTTRVLAPGLTGLRPCSDPVAVSPGRGSAALPPDVERLLDEVEQRARVTGAGAVLRSRLALFLAAVVPVVESAASALRTELDRHGVDLVAAANPSSIEEFAVLLAARQANVASTLYQHGDHLMPYDLWFLTELQNFDCLAASDASLVDDLPEAAERLGARCPAVAVSSPRVELLRRRRRPAPPGAPTCYLPMFFIADIAQVGAQAIDDAWAHRWHLRLLGFMAEQTDVQFVWKALPSVDYLPDPMADHLRENPVENVSYDTRPFQVVLPEVGRVICDFPSTALYETVHWGRPVLPLVFPRFVTVRPRAAALFRPALRICLDMSDALREVERFLSAEPSEYIVDPVPICPPASATARGAHR